MKSMLLNKPKLLLPVIHVQDLAQALRNVHLAKAAGCDGAFLINHETESGERPFDFRGLLEIHGAISAEFPNWWLGVNCLDLPAADVFQHLTPNVAGVWADNAEIDERLAVQDSAEKILAAKHQSGWTGSYFGGVAFKYQRPVADSAESARIAATYMDVVTTSGAGTGESAEIDKIKGMKAALGQNPLAIASGITCENIGRYLPYVDIFLVATGISHSFYELDADKVSRLAQLINNE